MYFPGLQIKAKPVRNLRFTGMVVVHMNLKQQWPSEQYGLHQHLITDKEGLIGLYFPSRSYIDSG